MLHAGTNNGRTFGPRRWLHTDPALTETMGEHRMADEGIKRCAACGQDKPKSDFHKNARMADGIRSSCKVCVLAGNRKSVLQHHEKRKREKREVYERVKNTPEYQTYSKAHREATKEAKSAYDREYNRRNSQKKVAQAAEWQKANRDRRSAITRNYDARRRLKTANGISTADLAAWMSSQKKVCYWCGGKCAKGFHVDHYVPLSKGGAHEAHNLVIACGPCNLRKNAKDPLDFAREVGRLL